MAPIVKFRSLKDSNLSLPLHDQEAVKVTTLKGSDCANEPLSQVDSPGVSAGTIGRRNLRGERGSVEAVLVLISPVLGARPICIISARQLDPLQ